MDDLFKKYYQKIASVLTEHSFVRKGRMFGRVVNDVFQGAAIEKLHRGQSFRECRIVFGVWPLCEGLTLSRCLDFSDRYYLRQFEIFHEYNSISIPERISAENAGAFGTALGRFLSVASGSVKLDNGSRFSWAYELTSDSIDACVAEMARFIIAYLVPFFERAKSCSTALNEIISIEKLFNSNRVASLREMGERDLANTPNGVVWNDHRKLLMALKAEDYDLAQRIATIMLDRAIDSYRSAQMYDHSSEGVEKWRLDVEEKETVLYRIRHQDIAYYQELLSKQEARSREELAIFAQQL